MIAELTEILDESRVLDENADPSYGSDSLNRLHGHFDAVVFPETTEEVSRILRFANENQIAITPRGAGTNLTGSTVPLKGGIIVDVSRMKKVLEIDPKTMTITVEPGLTLEELQNTVEKAGYFYPPDPGEKKASIGGNISTNAGGMRAVKYGVTRDYVKELEVVFADGSVHHLGSKNVKDASGLNLKELLVGSEGTLGIITRCVLKILPKPETSLSVLTAFESLQKGIDTVLDLIRSGVKPTAVEFMNREVVKLGEDYTGFLFPYPQAGSYILLTFDGSKQEAEESLQKAEAITAQHQALGYEILNDPQYASHVWKVRGALCTAVEAVSEQEPIDIVVPVDQTAKFIGFVDELEKKSGVQMVSFGHAGDGNVHLCIVRGNRSDEIWKQDLDKVLDQLYRKAESLQGLPSGEHGIGIQKQPYFHRQADPALVAAMNAIKEAFDPNRILNDGKSYLL